MITNKKELKYYINEDRKAMNYSTGITMKFIISYRKREYYYNMNKVRRILLFFPYLLNRVRYNSLSLLCGFSIPVNSIGPGLALPHYGSITVNNGTKIGKNCRILPCVTIGTTNKAAIIGDNVFIGSGAKIIGDVIVADGVCIAANAVVVKSIHEAGTTWGGIPCKKISNNDSKSNLSLYLFEEDNK